MEPKTNRYDRNDAGILLGMIFQIIKCLLIVMMFSRLSTLGPSDIFQASLVVYTIIISIYDLLGSLIMAYTIGLSGLLGYVFGFSPSSVVLLIIGEKILDLNELVMVYVFDTSFLLFGIVAGLIYIYCVRKKNAKIK